MANLTVRIIPSCNYSKDTDIYNLLKYINGHGSQKIQTSPYQNPSPTTIPATGKTCLPA